MVGGPDQVGRSLDERAVEVEDDSQIAHVEVPLPGAGKLATSRASVTDGLRLARAAAEAYE